MKTIISAFAICMVVNSLSSSAQPGTLDPTFSENGRVTIKVGDNAFGRSVAIQSNGKIVVAGYTNNVVNNNFALVRITRDGKPDNSFGTNGIVITDFGGGDGASSVALQADGKIVVAGTSDNDFALSRYRQNGKTDSTFGENGKVITDFGNINQASSVAIQADGKIVVAGNTHIGLSYDFELVRFQQNGKLDSSFGNDGRTFCDFGGSEDFARSMTIQPDGKIIVAGNSDQNFSLVRYREDGKPDSSFGNAGKVITKVRKYAYGYSVAVQPDGKIVMCGSSAREANYYDFSLIRYMQNGTIDSTFGDNGKVIADFESGGNEYAQSVAIQANGKIIVAGFAGLATSNFALIRYKSTGKPDGTFGTNGKVTTNFSGTTDYGYSVAIQDDGKIVVAGDAGSKFAVARYNGDTTLPASYENNNFSNLQKQENNSTHISLSPNPVKDLLNIQGLSSSAKTISIIDIAGRVMQKAITANTVYLFNLKQLNAGIYFVRINEGERIITIKFIKE